MSEREGMAFAVGLFLGALISTLSWWLHIFMIRAIA